MEVILVQVIFLGFIALVVSNEDGRYIPDDEGRYYPDDSGRYSHDGTGGYRDDGTGKYSGLNDKYTASSRNTVVRSPPSTRPPTTRPPTTTTTTTTPPPNYYYNYNNVRDGNYKIIRQVNDIDTSGGYHWEYETENKIQAEESGKLFNEGTKDEGIRAKGFFEYVGPDDVLYSIVYTADENGFFPVGNHLPTPPPIPEALAKALGQVSQNQV